MTNPKEVLAHYQTEWEQKVRNMEPGPELDALVAEKVMGECRHDYEQFGPNVWNYICKKCGFQDSKFTKPLIIAGTKKKYSTDDATALEVAESFQEYEICKSDGQYVVSVGRPGYFARAEKLSEAICKAALLAVMEGEGE